MQRDFWLERWDTGRIAFHDPRGDPRLPARWSALGVAVGSRVLVTLCGKSVDMRWLAGQGYTVVGVELSELAARSFFQENGLAFAVEARGSFAALRSAQPGIDITILVGDFFDLDAAVLGTVQAVYDRAATIALPKPMRTRYADHLTGLVAAGSPMLLIAIEYDERLMSGPPFSLADADVRALYARAFDVHLVDEVHGPEVAGRLRERGLPTMTERAYCLLRQ